MSDFGKLMGPMARRIGNMFSRGIVSSSSATRKMQTLQLRLMAGEQKDDVEHFEPFGFTSRPLPGAEHVSLFFDGDRSHGVTLVVADRRYRLTGLAEGEAALHDAFGNKAHFKQDGTLDVVASTKVQITSPLVTMSGNLQVTGTITATVDVVGGGKSLKNHTHPGVQAGGSSTGAPN
ncbi:MAG: phage baseplate assembly protein V [Aquabacterium sp.]|nr:phage baseplate assembly protein V [Aquabacterium sp.]